MNNDQTAKADAGKPRISLVPPQIMRDIAIIREYGNEKYHDPENWRQVSEERFIDAMMRHLLCFIEDPSGVDEESGFPHYMHAACNLAFICQIEAEKKKKLTKDLSDITQLYYAYTEDELSRINAFRTELQKFHNSPITLIPADDTDSDTYWGMERKDK